MRASGACGSGSNPLGTIQNAMVLMSEDEPNWEGWKKRKGNNHRTTTQNSLSTLPLSLDQSAIEIGLERLVERLPNEHTYTNAEAMKNTQLAIIANKREIAGEIAKDPELVKYITERPPYRAGGIRFLGISIPRDTRKNAEEHKGSILRIAQRVSEQAEEREIARKRAAAEVKKAAANAGALVRRVENAGQRERLFGAEKEKKGKLVQKKLF